MNGRLLAQIAIVAWRDSEALYGDPYAWPPASPPPENDARAEARRLRVLASRIMLAARDAGFFGQSMDEIFGDA